MRKIVAYELLSLDGVAEHPDRFFTDWDKEMDANLADVIGAQDAVVLGRRSYDEWAEEQRSYYREQYLRLLEILAQSAQKAEEWSRSLSIAQRILREDPFREDVHCVMMRAHAAQGNRVAVREQYETLRKLLRKELGVEPSAETQRAYKEFLK